MTVKDARDVGRTALIKTLRRCICVIEKCQGDIYDRIEPIIEDEKLARLRTDIAGAGSDQDRLESCLKNWMPPAESGTDYEASKLLAFIETWHEITGPRDKDQNHKNDARDSTRRLVRSGLSEHISSHFFYLFSYQRAPGPDSLTLLNWGLFGPPKRAEATQVRERVEGTARRDAESVFKTGVRETAKTVAHSVGVGEATVKGYRRKPLYRDLYRVQLDALNYAKSKD